MRLVFKFILFGLLFNLAAFFIASTGWFRNTLFGNAVSTLSLNDPTTLSSAEDIFLRMLANNVDANPIVSWLGLDGWAAAASFGVLVAGFVTVSVIAGIVSKGGGTSMIGMAIVSMLFYTMYASSRTFFDNLLENFPEQTNYITVMVAFGILFIFIVVIADFSSGQKSTS